MPWSPRTAHALSLALVVLMSACGSSPASSRVRPVNAVSLLHGAPAPRGWVDVHSVAGGVVVTAPATWHPVAGDPGSVTVELGRDPDRPVGYLNATPAVAGERLGSWVSFRLHHNREEGDRHVRLLDARRRVPFGHGIVAACVQDAYSTPTARYIEVACLTRATMGRTVIVAAPPTQAWSREWPTLTRAVDSIS